MAVARIRQQLYTPEEYLAMEEAADHRSEYYQGQIYAMVGGTFNHEVIAGNFHAALHRYAQNGKCVAFSSNMRLLVEKHGLYTYPDAMLVCGKPQFVPNRTDIILNPLILVEVLSKSTRAYDRGDKFEFYRSIPTFQDYVMVDQDRVFVEYYHKLSAQRWVLTEISDPAAVLTLQSIKLELPVSQLYNQVDWFAA
jgi:Uma2 family endonuclease